MDPSPVGTFAAAKAAADAAANSCALESLSFAIVATAAIAVVVEFAGASGI